jgi:hypothetical protein
LQAKDYAATAASCPRVKLVRYTGWQGRSAFGLAPGDYVVFVLDIDPENGIYQVARNQVNSIKSGDVLNIVLEGSIDPALSRSLLGIQRGKSFFDGLRGLGADQYRQLAGEDLFVLPTLKVKATDQTLDPISGVTGAVPVNVEVRMFASDNDCLDDKTDSQAFSECGGDYGPLDVPPSGATYSKPFWQPGNYKLVGKSALSDRYASQTVTLTAGETTEADIVFSDSGEDQPVATVSGDAVVLAQGDTLWGTVATLARKSQVVSSDDIKSLAKLVAEKNNIAVPEWGIKGLTQASQMRIGSIVDLSPLQDWLKARK